MSLPCTVLSAQANVASEPSPSTMDSYGRLLGLYITPRGVRYAAWRASPEDMSALSRLVMDMSKVDPAKLGASERTAFYINLYNATILEIVLTKKPKSSIKEITPGVTGYGVFIKHSVAIGSKKISLRELEDRLRSESKDPRIHFAINCASRSCPPIAPEPYRAGTLDAQLEASTRAFLASSGALVLKNRTDDAKAIEPVVEVSKIFDWYAKDFAAAGGAPAFLRKYGPPVIATAIEQSGGRAKLDFQDYDWSLNTAP